MIQQNQPCDPAVHSLAVRCANKLVWIIQACLREEERVEAAHQFYLVLVEELAKNPGREPEV
jgi:hypothetical protein